jgi:hypothetical protein
MEVNIVQHLFFTDFYMQIFYLEHRLIIENISMAALNAFESDEK